MEKTQEVFKNPKKAADAGDGAQDLAALIAQKLETGDFIDGDKFDSMTDVERGSTLDPKVIAAYKKVGIVMKSFKSGKLPKAFKIIPQT